MKLALTLVIVMDHSSACMEWTVKQKASDKKEKDPKDPEKVKTVSPKKGVIASAPMFKGYSIKVRGEIPEDIIEKISRIHAAAVRQGKQSENRDKEGKQN